LCAALQASDDVDGDDEDNDEEVDTILRNCVINTVMQGDAKIRCSIRNM